MKVTLPGEAVSAPRVRRRGVAILIVAWALATAARFALTPPGLRGDYFSTSNWTGAVAHSSIDSEVSTAQIARSWRFSVPDSFSGQWFGWVFVDRDADYAVETSAIGRAQITIDSALVVDSDRDGVATGGIRLARGPHAVVIRYAQAGGAYHFEWSLAPVGEPLERVADWRLSTRRSTYAELIARRLVDVLWLALTIVLAIAAIWWALQPRTRSTDGALRDEEPAALPRLGTRPTVAALALFTALAILNTWPLATSPARLSRNDNADTVLNEWTMAWVAHEGPRHPMVLFDANIFYPERRALAFSESLLLQSAMGAPVLWLGGSPVLAYNLVLIAGFALTGWSMCLVVAAWTRSWFAGVAAGAIVAFNAHTLTRLPHIQAQHAEFLPLALFALDSLLRRPRWRAAMWLAVWTALQGFASVYLLVFTIVALAVGAAVRPGDWTGARFRLAAPKLVGAALAGGVALAPLLLPYWRLHQSGFARSLDEAAFFAATAGDYLAGQSRLWARAAHTTALFPGAIALALAALAILRGRAVKDARARMCLAFGICGAVLSLGPAVAPGYELLYSTVPLVGAVRVSGRFGYLAIVAVAVLAGFGVAAVRRWVSAPRAVAIAVPLAIVLAVIIEPIAAPISYTLPEKLPSIYGRASGGGIVIELPFPPPDAPYRNAPYLLNSTLNWRPLVNGYSGFVPPSYVAHYEALKDFPDAASIAALERIGVTDAFVHLDQLAPDAAVRLDRSPALQRIASDGPIALYRVNASAARAERGSASSVAPRISSRCTPSTARPRSLRIPPDRRPDPSASAFPGGGRRARAGAS